MFKISVPGSSANIGPGFDCLAIAFNVFNHFTFEESETNEFVGFDQKYCNENNLIFKAYKWAFQQIDMPFKAVKITFDGEIPASRGLGSSSTCICAGIAAAFEISNKKWDKNELAYLASVYEGHPDNVTAAVFGGFTSSLIFQNSLCAKKFEIHPSFKFFALIPNFELSTKLSRESIPKTTLLVNAKRNIANVTMLMKAFEMGDSTLLSIASADYLHQPYRGMLINGYFTIYNEAINSGVDAVFLSGAGPTMLAVGKNDLTKCLESIVSKQGNWKVVPLTVNRDGLQISRS